MKHKLKDVLNFIHDKGFTKFIESLPQSYNTIIGEEGINLSGGQKQMISIMRALYFKPQLLILDEATSAMDRKSEKFVFSLLQRLKNELAIILITHKLHSLRTLCDNIYVIEDGIISASGDHQSVVNTNNFYSKSWDVV